MLHVKKSLLKLTGLIFIIILLSIGSYNQQTIVNKILTEEFGKSDFNEKNFKGKDYTTDKISNLTDISPRMSLISNITKNNVATFDVLESIESTTPQTDLYVNNENLTVEIPENWTITQQQFDINALAQKYQLAFDPNVSNNDIADPSWTFWTEHPPGIDRLGFVGHSINEDLNITAKESFSFTPKADIAQDAFAVWYQNITKPDPEMEIYESDYISAGTTQYPLWNDFSTEPDWDNKTIIDSTGNDWQKDTNNPYGGEKGYATRTLSYDDVQDSLDAYIHAGSSNLTLGNPSLGWKVNFTEPTSPDFSPKKYELIMYWSVENLNYDAHDNLSVIARIDNQYVDGRYDAYGNEYLNNATAYSIENSYNNEAFLDHDPIVRVFDVTELIDNRKANHTLDFGIWLENINETNDEVEVKFYGVFLRAIEEDQYDIGDLGFNCSINFQSTDQMEDWVLFGIFANQSHDTWFPIGYLQDLFDTPDDSHFFNFNLPSRLKGLLNSPWVFLYLGIINVG